MYVCICNALSERKIKETLASNGGCPVGVYRDLGCRPRCGKCVEHVYTMARDTRSPSPDGAAAA